MIPLAASSERIATEALRIAAVIDVARAWASPAGWTVDTVESAQDGIVVRAAGRLPVPSRQALRDALDRAGLENVDVRLVLTPEERIELDATGS